MQINDIQDLQNYEYRLWQAQRRLQGLRNKVREFELCLPGFKQALELVEIILQHEINANGEQIDAKQ